MLEQERLIDRVRQRCLVDASLEGVLMYGSFTQRHGDEWSDIEFWLFFDDDRFPEVDPKAWCAEISPVHLVGSTSQERT